mgnify:CR=1 FL=1
MKKKELIKQSDINAEYNLTNTMGEPIYLRDEKVIIPINKVLYGFGNGESELHITNDPNELTYEFVDDIYPYKANIGATHVKPYAIAILDKEKIKIVKIDNDSLYDKSLDLIEKIIKKNFNK